MYEYKALITSVYDGDGTFKAIVELGFGFTMERDLRLHGVDTPEMTSTQRAAGIVVRDYVRDLILDKEVIIRTYKDETGKYGRIMCDIIIPREGRDINLGARLIRKKYAQEYDGGTKKRWNIDMLNYIVNNKT